MKKDIEYLAKNFETEMENFSFAKAIIDVGAVWATVGVAETAGATAALGLGKIFAGAGKGVVKNTTKSIPIPADFDRWIDQEKDERGDFYKKIAEYCEKKNIDEVDMYKKPD